eukprot:544895-Pelagomonas_calceolata.AAC.5
MAQASGDASKQCACKHMHPHPPCCTPCNHACSDEEEIRIEELIASVDLSTVSIPIGTRARVVKANLANTNVGDTSLKRSLRRVRASFS